MKPFFTTAAFLAASLAAVPLLAHDGVLGAQVRPLLAQPIPNIPGKSLVAVEVDYPPGGASPAHRHAPSAFIYAYVLEGEVTSQIEGQPLRTYHRGEGWYEDPGAHHVVSRNASPDHPARLLAVFVADSADKPLTLPDHQ